MSYNLIIIMILILPQAFVTSNANPNTTTESLSTKIYQSNYVPKETDTQDNFDKSEPKVESQENVPLVNVLLQDKGHCHEYLYPLIEFLQTMVLMLIAFGVLLKVYKYLLRREMLQNNHVVPIPERFTYILTVLFFLTALIAVAIIVVIVNSSLNN